MSTAMQDAATERKAKLAALKKRKELHDTDPRLMRDRSRPGPFTQLASTRPLSIPRMPSSRKPYRRPALDLPRLPSIMLGVLAVSTARVSASHPSMPADVDPLTGKWGRY